MIEVVPVERLIRLDDGCTLGQLTGDPTETRGLRHEDLGWLASGIAPAEGAPLDLFPVLVAAQQVIPPGVGYRMHAHHGLETVTIVLAGSYVHELGHDRAVVAAGEVAVVSTGRGAAHQETTRPGPPLRTIFLWVRSNAPDGHPGFACRRFADRANRLVTVVSGSGASGALPVCAALEVMTGRFDRGREIRCQLARGYVIPADGAIEIAGTVVQAGERARVYGELTARALAPTEVVVVAV
jgi:redox-sensitive bicupin YhaK (pirin superfamily)